MTIAVTIRDESTSGEVVFEQLLAVSAQYLTVKQLIEARVRAEVERYNNSKQETYQGLVQPTEAEALLNGCRLKKGVSIDVEKQQKAAVRAFTNNGFFLLVDDQQVTELEDTVFVTSETVVSFLKLVPLVGG